MGATVAIAVHVKLDSIRASLALKTVCLVVLGSFPLSLLPHRLCFAFHANRILSLRREVKVKSTVLATLDIPSSRVVALPVLWANINL